MSKTIFNREYDLNENSTIKIYLNKTSLLNSDIIENVILKSNKEEIEFDISICFNMNNHYQVILDKNKDLVSLNLFSFLKIIIFQRK